MVHGRRHRDDESVRISKAMSYLLRHGAKKEGIAMRDDGYVRLPELLQHLKGASEAHVLQIVATNDKKRFSTTAENGSVWIRANQGHSLQVEDAKLLVPVVDARQVDICVHGTYHRCLGAILAGGLSRMSRNHVHFAPALPAAGSTATTGEPNVISGMRTNCEVAIFVDVARAMAMGLQFFTSANGVILTPGNADGKVPPACFARVLDRRTGTDIPLPPQHAVAASAGVPTSVSISVRDGRKYTIGAMASCRNPAHGAVKGVVLDITPLPGKASAPFAATLLINTSSFDTSSNAAAVAAGTAEDAVNSASEAHKGLRVDPSDGCRSPFASFVEVYGQQEAHRLWEQAGKPVTSAAALSAVEPPSTGQCGSESELAVQPLIPASLAALWSRMHGPSRANHAEVLGFYSHTTDKRWAIFSNFFIGAPFSFDLPTAFLPSDSGSGAASDFPTPVVVQFSEAAIMLCKAALMGDAASYARIAAASTPAEAKMLGRGVRPFDQARWEANVCAIAEEVIWQKFTKSGQLTSLSISLPASDSCHISLSDSELHHDPPRYTVDEDRRAAWEAAGLPTLAQALLSTGNCIIAEATRNDRHWGIGLDTHEPDVQVPSKWQGTNILGWALMRVRERLQAHLCALDRDCTTRKSTIWTASPDAQNLAAANTARKRRTSGKGRRSGRLQ